MKKTAFNTMWKKKINLNSDISLVFIKKKHLKQKILDLCAIRGVVKLLSFSN